MHTVWKVIQKLRVPLQTYGYHHVFHKHIKVPNNVKNGAVEPTTPPESSQDTDNGLGEYVEYDDEKQKPVVIEITDSDDDTKEIEVEGNEVKEYKAKIEEEECKVKIEEKEEVNNEKQRIEPPTQPESCHDTDNGMGEYVEYEEEEQKPMII